MARARIQLLFGFINAIKYIKDTMVDDHCMAHWSHKFVYVCTCFGGFFVLFFFFSFLLYYIKIFGLYAW